MNNVSKKAVARAFVSLLEKYSFKELLPALAREIIAHRWTRELDVLIREISRELLTQRKQLTATVVSAHRLSSDLVTRLKQWLAQRTGASVITLSTHQDPSLVGGVIISTPTEEIDMSLRTQLKHLYAR